MDDSIVIKVAAYRAASLESNGESDEKCRIVEELEHRLHDPEALDFLLDLIDNPAEYDMARLEALKVLEAWEPPSDSHRTLVGLRLASSLPRERDVLVQQWMAKAAANFAEVPGLYFAVVELLADPNADLDVRHNCLTAIWRLGPTERVRERLELLTNDADIGIHVQRILKEWDNGTT